MNIYTPIVLLFILFFLDIPVAFALIASSLFYFLFIGDVIPINLVMQQFTSSLESFPYLAVPFFIMVGSVMNYAGISQSLMKMADVMTGHLRGGLAQVNIVLSALMGGISGSANADAAMQSKILVPQMVQRGYSKEFSAAITAASSSISPVIPPGTNLIIYSLLANVSVSEMFLAGYTPGLIMALALMITVYFLAVKRGYKPSREKRATPKEFFLQLIESIWGLLIPFGIILGMRFGLLTPTEGGGVAVLFCVIVGIFVYKQLSIKHIPAILKDTVLGTGAVMFLIVGAKVFGYYLTLEQIPQGITQALLTMTESPFVLLIFINVLLLFVGMFIEGGAALIILGPLLIPAVAQFGINLTHFGVVFIINIMIGGLTPPFGSMMFTTCTIVGVRLQDFTKEVLPFIGALLGVLLLFTYWADLALFLPNLLGVKH